MSARVDLVIRKARLDESDAVARLHRRTTLESLPFIPTLHTLEEDAAFYRETVFTLCTVWAAVEREAILGFCAVRAGWVDHFYVAPERQGQGIGRTLLTTALRRRRRVRLWTVQRNLRARAFYAAFGFVEVRFTDGAHNEEREPDVLLEWTRQAWPRPV